MLARMFKPYSHAQAHGSLRPSYQEVNTITRLQQAWGGQVKPASYGPPGEGKVRWCASCAESHPGARCLSNPCEDCQRKTADYVSRGEGNPAGVLLVRSHMQGRNCRSNSCEDCQMKPASYDTLGEGKRRWCASCAESHPGARCLTGESREACQMKTASTHLDGCSLSARQVRPKRPQLNQRDDLPYAPLVNDAVAAAMAGIAVAPALGDQDRRRLQRLQSEVLYTAKTELGELKVSSALAEEQIMAMRSREQIDTVSSAAVVAQDVLSDVHSAVEFDGGDTFAIDAIQQPVIGQHVADGGLFCSESHANQQRATHDTNEAVAAANPPSLQAMDDCEAMELTADRAVLNFPPTGHCQPQLTSQYRGVHWCKVSKKWKAQIQYEGKKMCLGSFDNEREAALAYDCKATELQGESAALNILPTDVLITPAVRIQCCRRSD